MRSTSAIHARAGALVAALLCALVVVATAAAGSAHAAPAGPPDGVNEQTCAADKQAGKQVTDWCRVIEETRVTRECADAAPVDPAEKFSAACQANYTMLSKGCAPMGPRLPWSDWECSQFKAAWAGKRTPAGDTRPAPATN